MQSGFGWDDEQKAVTASDAVWDAYIAINVKCCFFIDFSHRLSFRVTLKPPDSKENPFRSMMTCQSLLMVQ
jgi:hypothetical protein